MPTTDTNTRWTVIPRGLSKDGKRLTFAVAVTPVPADSDAATIPTDADPWNQWLANCGNAAGQPCSVTLQAGGRQISIPNVTLPALPNVDYDTTALWAKLLAYSNASWAGAGTQAAGPDTQSTALQLAADPNARTATTRTADLHQHMNHIHAAGVLAARRRRTNGGDDSAGRKPSAATTKGQGAKKLAAEQATRKSIYDSLRTHLGGLSYLALPAQRGLHSLSAAAADCFRNWLKTELASSDPLRRLKARAAERNLYRLSGNPYNTLAADVFATVVQLAGGTLNCPGVDPATSRRAVLIQHSIFHRRYQAKNTPGTPRKPRDEAPATLQDFYRTLNLISRYPELLHPLGLAFDFNSVDFSAANLDGNTPFTVTFRAPSSLKQEPTIIYTSCSGDGFATSPSRVIGDFVIAGGMLALNTCQAITRDIDGESLRTAQNSNVINSTDAKNAAEAAAPTTPQPGAADANEPDNTTNPDRDTTLPMRTVGVSLVHPDAPDHIHNRLQTSFTQRQSATTANAAAAGTAPASITLGLNDLVRGFTVRIRREGEKKALSVTSRSVTYTLTAKNGGDYHLVDDQRDFPIELSATTTHDSATPQTGTQTGVPDLHLHPALFRYTGWGLTVDTPFPRTQSTTDKTPPTPPVPTFYNPPADDDLRWPRFRYGTHYLQLQTMDLLCTPIQGGSTPPYLDANHKALPSQTELSFQYLRSDPVHGPTMLLQLTDSPKFQPDTYKECFRLGESMGCMVLHDGEFQPLTRRVLVPPVASLDQLLPHGVLDDDRGLRRDLNSIGTFHDVAILDSGDFPTVTNPPHKDPNDPTKLVKSKKTAPIYIKPDRTPPSRTYLPDPMAQHLVAEIIDLSDPAQAIIDSSELNGLEPGDFYPFRPDGTRPAWPNAVRLAVQMEQPTDKSRPTTRWNLDQQNQVMTLYVGIPHGWQVKLHLKCTPSRTNAKEVFDLPTSLAATGDEDAWLETINLKDQFDPETHQLLKSQLTNIDDNARRLALGHIDQLTPSTELLLIHSIKQPLKTSAVDQPPIDPKTGKRTGNAVQVQQFYDSPLVQFSLAVNIGDRRSTSKVELVADWTDIVDTPSNTAPPSTKDDGHNRAFTQNAHIKQWPLSLQANTDTQSNGQEDQQKFSSIAQTFPDTKYRVIHLSVNAISRFVPYYVPASAKNSDETAYTLPGASADTVDIELQNTARLDPLRLNRIMPLRWTHRQHFRDGTTCSTHFGAGFRILIDRAFNGTPATDGGQGELLGIALWGESFPSPQTTNYDSAISFAPSAYHSWAADDALQPYVTRWGADPGLSTGNLPSPSPTSPQFHHPSIQPQTEEQRKNDEPQIPAAADIAKCAFPADLPLSYDTQPQQCDPTTVPYFTVAKYPVQWDNEEKLWYADVQLTAPPVIKDKDRKASPTDGIPAGFIRFALIRYQPNSLINRECSRVTIAPLMPIPPHRELWFNKRQGSIVKLQIDGTAQDPNATTTRRDFKVELQRRSLFSSRRKNRWETVDIPGQDTTPQPFHTGLHYPTLATWSLTLNPVWFWPWSHVYRIVVREYETLFADTEGNRGARAIKQRLVDTIIEAVP